MSGGTQPTVVANTPPSSPAKQPSSTGEHEVSPASVSDPQPRLTKQQKVLKDKLGLDERVCASCDPGGKKVETFLANLEEGKFDPGPLRRFLLRLSSLFGGPEYEVAVKQFTVKTATAKSQGLFLNVLAAAIKSCDSEELPQVLPVVHDLLAANPAARRDFFINKLLIPCLGEVHMEASKSGNEIDIKNFVENYKRYSTIEKLCLGNGMQCTTEENTQITPLHLTDKDYISLTKEAIYRAITSPTNERDLHLQNLQHMKSLPRATRLCELHFEIVDSVHGDFTSLLGCFGEEQEKQLGNFKALVDGLRNIANEILLQNQGAWAQAFISKASEFLFENTELLYAMLKLAQTHSDFMQILLPEIINFRGGGDDMLNTIFSAARQTMKNAMQPNSGSLSDEQVKLLCEGVNLSAMLENERVVEKNKDTIDMILRFIQDRAFDSTNPRISFEDIMSENISPETCQRLLAFVKDESRNYDQRLVKFIESGVAQRTARRTPSNQ